MDGHYQERHERIWPRQKTEMLVIDGGNGRHTLVYVGMRRNSSTSKVVKPRTNPVQRLI